MGLGPVLTNVQRARQLRLRVPNVATCLPRVDLTKCIVQQLEIIAVVQSYLPAHTRMRYQILPALLPESACMDDTMITTLRAHIASRAFVRHDGVRHHPKLGRASHDAPGASATGQPAENPVYRRHLARAGCATCAPAGGGSAYERLAPLWSDALARTYRSWAGPRTMRPGPQLPASPPRTRCTGGI
jgi:hypothetical protein